MGQGRGGAPEPRRPWRVRLLEITTGAPPPHWELRLWEYPKVLFNAYAITGSAMRDMLTNGAVRVGDATVALAPQGDTVTVERRPSRSRYGPFEPLDWPADGTKLNLTEFQQNEPTGPLLSEGDAPSFAGFFSAAAFFFWSSGQVTGGQFNPDAVHRHQDQRGRLNTIRAVLADDVLEVESKVKPSAG